MEGRGRSWKGREVKGVRVKEKKTREEKEAEGEGKEDRRWRRDKGKEIGGTYRWESEERKDMKERKVGGKGKKG